MPRVGFEPTISVGERPQTYVLECAATGTGLTTIMLFKQITIIIAFQFIWFRHLKCVELRTCFLITFLFIYFPLLIALCKRKKWRCPKTSSHCRLIQLIRMAKTGSPLSCNSLANSCTCSSIIYLFFSTDFAAPLVMLPLAAAPVDPVLNPATSLPIGHVGIL